MAVALIDVVPDVFVEAGEHGGPVLLVESGVIMFDEFEIGHFEIRLVSFALYNFTKK